MHPHLTQHGTRLAPPRGHWHLRPRPSVRPLRPRGQAPQRHQARPPARSLLGRRRRPAHRHGLALAVHGRHLAKEAVWPQAHKAPHPGGKVPSTHPVTVRRWFEGPLGFPRFCAITCVHLHGVGIGVHFLCRICMQTREHLMSRLNKTSLPMTTMYGYPAVHCALTTRVVQKGKRPLRRYPKSPRGPAARSLLRQGVVAPSNVRRQRKCSSPDTPP